MSRYEAFYMESLEILGGGLHTAVSFSLIDS